jgi:hypothetical protein
MRSSAMPFVLVVARAIAVLGCLLPALSIAQPAPEPQSFGPYVPTPWVIVDEIMKLAAIGPDDYVVDLGSGDGRLVITAASRHGARGGFGVDIDAALVRLANDNAAREGVASRVQFFNRDLYVTDVSAATVVTLYLLPHTMPRLEPKLLAELRPGARVVSHDYPFSNWPHERFVKMDVQEKIAISGTPRTTLYLYIVPARIAGEWELSLPASLSPAPLPMAITQRPDGAAGRVRIGERWIPVADIALHGEAVSMSISGLKPGPLTLHGRAHDDTIEGTLASGARWKATRRR